MPKQPQFTTIDFENALVDLAETFNVVVAKAPRIETILNQDGARTAFRSLVAKIQRRCDIDIEDVLGRALQTVYLLPEADFPKPSKRRAQSEKRGLRHVNEALRGLAEELKRFAESPEERERMDVFLRSETDETLIRRAQRFLRIPDEMREYADFREGLYRQTQRIASAKKAIPESPRKRTVQYILNFFFCVIGQRPYNEIALLIDSTFRAAGTSVPTWINGAALKTSISRRKSRSIS